MTAKKMNAFTQPSPPTRLPGFLRRSARNTYEASSREVSTATLNTTGTAVGQREEAQGHSLPNNSRESHLNAVVRTSSNQYSVSNRVGNRRRMEKTSALSDDQTKSVEKKHASDGEYIHDTAKITSISFREAEFEKIMLAPVVNLMELRKLAWNGIPVSSVHY
jgi:hypothetical protein